MAARMQRTQILLKPEQHRALRAIAQREERSLSDVVREMLQVQLDQRAQSEAARRQRRLDALERIQQHRQAILARRDGVPLEIDPTNLVQEVRGERHADIVGPTGPSRS